MRRKMSDPVPHQKIRCGKIGVQRRNSAHRFPKDRMVRQNKIVPAFDRFLRNRNGQIERDENIFDLVVIRSDQKSDVVVIQRKRLRRDRFHPFAKFVKLHV